MADLRACRDDDVVANLDLLHARISAGQRELLRYVAEYDRRGRWQQDGCRDTAQWLSGRFGITNWAARRWVAAAYALEGLPKTSEALETGVLCLDKVLELSRFATPETEKKLITWAKRVSAAAIRRKADLAARSALEEVRENEEARYLRWWWFDDGKSLGLEGRLPAADGAAVVKAITRLADKLPGGPNDETNDVERRDESTLEERCADALTAMAMNTIDDDADADRATVVVHTVLSSLDHDRYGSEIAGGPVIHPEVARRLSCDARLQVVLNDREGNALGIGRVSRNVPPWLMRELVFRDRACTFPGCDARAFLQAHHIWHWEDGGPTDLDNLVLTCHFHHKLVHDFGWDVRLNGSTAEWLRPTGRLYAPGPDPPPQQIDPEYFMPSFELAGLAAI